MKPKPQSLLDVLHRSVMSNLERQFTELRAHFASHPLFVMFEPRLNCNPKTDHLLPKDVYPLFSEVLERARGILAVQLTLDASQAIDGFFGYSASCGSAGAAAGEYFGAENGGKLYNIYEELKNESNSIPAPFSKDPELPPAPAAAEVSQLRQLLKQTKKDHEEEAREAQLEKNRLMSEIKDIKEEIYIMSRSGMCYAPDFLAEFLAQPRLGDKARARAEPATARGAKTAEIERKPAIVYEEEDNGKGAEKDIIIEEETVQPVASGSPAESGPVAQNLRPTEVEEQAVQFDIAACYMEKMLEAEQGEKAAIRALLQAKEENKQFSAEILQAKQLVTLLRDRVTNKEWSDLIEHQQALIQQNTENNHHNFIRELSMQRLVDRKGVEGTGAVSSRKERQAADISIPVSKLLGTAPEMMDYASIASLEARYKALLDERNGLHAANQELERSYEEAKESLHDLGIRYGDCEERLRQALAKSKKEPRMSREGSKRSLADVENDSWQQEPSKMHTPRRQENSPSTYSGIQDVIERMVGEGIKLQQMSLQNGRFQSPDGNLAISRAEMRVLERFCELEQKKLNILTPSMPDRVPPVLNNSPCKDSQIEQTPEIPHFTSSMSDVFAAQGALTGGTQRTPDEDGISRNRYSSDDSVPEEDEQTASSCRISAFVPTAPAVSEIPEEVLAPVMDEQQAQSPVALEKTDSPQEAENGVVQGNKTDIAPVEQEEEAENEGMKAEEEISTEQPLLQTSDREFNSLEFIGLVGGQPTLHEFMRDNGLDQKGIEAVLSLVQTLQAGEPPELEMRQFEAENAELDFGIQVLNEIEEVVKMPVEVANAACQCGGEAETERLDEEEQENLVNYRVQQHLNAKEHTEQNSALYRNYYYDVPGHNVYEKLFNAAKTLRQRQQERVVRYVKEEQTYQLSRLEEKLATERIFGQTFLPEVDVARGEPPSIIRENILPLENDDVAHEKSVLKERSEQLESIISERMNSIERLKHSSPVSKRTILTFAELEHEWNSHIEESKILYLEEVGLTQDTLVKKELDFLANLPGDQFKNVVKPMVMQKPQQFEGYLNKSLGINKRRSNSTMASTSDRMVESIEIGQQLPELTKTMGSSFSRKSINNELSKQFVFEQDK